MKRDSKYELLRIVGMIAITVSHIPSVAPAGTAVHLIRSVNYCGGGFGVDVFVILGCWFLVNQDYRIERALRLGMQVVFYNALLLLLSHILGTRLSFADCIKGVSYWFPFGYVCMLMIMPAVKKMKAQTKKTYVFVVGLLCLFITVIIAFGTSNSVTGLFSKGLFIGPVWFIWIYMFFDCYRDSLEQFFKRINKFFLLLISISLFTAMSILVETNNMASIRAVYSPFAFLSALSLFGFFYNIKIQRVRWINAIASNAMGVYLIQCHPIFRRYVWEYIVNFKKLSLMRFDIYVLYIIIIIASLCIFAFCVEILWNKTYSMLNKWHVYQSFCLMVNNKFSSATIQTNVNNA